MLKSNYQECEKKFGYDKYLFIHLPALYNKAHFSFTYFPMESVKFFEIDFKLPTYKIQFAKRIYKHSVKIFTKSKLNT